MEGYHQRLAEDTRIFKIFIQEEGKLQKTLTGRDAVMWKSDLPT